MQMLYNSESFALLQFDVAPREDAEVDAPRRGGYEIVDKFGRKGIFLAGDLAETFQRGVQALIERGPSEEDFDEYLAGFAGLAQQTVRLH